MFCRYCILYGKRNTVILKLSIIWKAKHCPWQRGVKQSAVPDSAELSSLLSMQDREYVRPSFNTYSHYFDTTEYITNNTYLQYNTVTSYDIFWEFVKCLSFKIKCVFKQNFSMRKNTNVIRPFIFTCTNV